MAQIYFRYATMNAGKSIDVLKVVHNYEEQDKKVLLYTSILDTRAGEGLVSSRIGIQKQSYVIAPETDIAAHVLTCQESFGEKIFCVIVDESQFLLESHILSLVKVADEYDIPVICYGLKNDFKNNLFTGSEALLRFADKIEEIKTICSVKSCGKKATMVLRYVDGKPQTTGPQILIGGNKSYHSVCRKHYYNPE